MVNSLKLNSEVKIIPTNLDGILTGFVTNIASDQFVVSSAKLPNIDLINNEPVEILVKTQSCILKFNANIIDITGNMLTISLPEKIKIIQRREYPRVSMNYDLMIKDTSRPNNFSRATLINLSGGGVNLETDDEYSVGAILETKLDFIKTKEIPVLLDVVRMITSENKNTLSAAFKKISNSDRILVIQLCLKKQLEQKYKNSVMKNGGKQD